MGDWLGGRLGGGGGQSKGGVLSTMPSETKSVLYLCKLSDSLAMSHACLGKTTVCHSLLPSHTLSSRLTQQNACADEDV